MKTKGLLIFLMCLLAFLGFWGFLSIWHQQQESFLQQPVQLTPIAEFNHGAWIQHVAFSPTNPDLIASVGTDTSLTTNPDSIYVVKLWNQSDVNKPKVLFPVPLDKNGAPAMVDSIAFGRTGVFFAIKSFWNLELWDVTSGKKINSFELPSRTAAFSPNMFHFATASNDVKLWDIRNIRDKNEIPGIVVLPWKMGQQPLTHDGARTVYHHNETRYQVYNVIGFSHDGKWIAAGDHMPDVQGILRETVKVWDLQHKQLFKILPRHFPMDLKLEPNTDYSDIKSIEFSPDNRFLAVAGKFGYTIWTLPDWHIYYEVRDQNINDVAFSPDGRTFVVASDSTTLWSVEDLTPIAQLRIGGEFHEEFFKSTGVVTFSQDSNTLAGGGMDGIVRLWNVGKLNKN